MSSVNFRTASRFVVAMFSILSLLIGTTAFADESGWDRFAFTVSGYKASIDTQVRLDSTSQIPGTELDLEEDLQLDDSATLTQYDASLRITQQISVEGSYFELGRSAPTTLAGSVQFGDAVFPVNTDATTQFDADVATVGLRWAFLQSDRVELATSAGAYWLSLATGIEAPAAGLSESAEASSVLPMAGLSFGWNLTPKLQLTLNGDYMSIDVQDFEGSIVHLRAGLRYRILNNIGIGVGYDLLDLDAESTSSSFSGLFAYRQQGPKAFLAARF